MRRAAIFTVLVVSILVFGVFRTPAASAHAVLLRSDPAAGATLGSAPKQIHLWFSEGLSRDLTTVRLLGSDGKEAAPLQLVYNIADDREVSADVPDLAKGTYVIAWSAFSTVDGHSLDGSVSFGIGVAPTASASTSISPDFRPSSAEVGARWLTLLGLLALGGAVTVAFLTGRREDGPAHVTWVYNATTLAAIVLALAGDVASLLLRAHRAGGIDEVGAILTGSTWGSLWIARAVFLLVALALATFVLRWQAVRKPIVRYAMAPLAGAVLLTESLSSHAATRASNLPVLADYLHLLASSVWIGTVFGLASLIVWSRRDTTGVRRVYVSSVVRRFSVVAVASFALILATGVYRTLQEVPALGAFVDTTYGKALTVKLALVILVLALGATNYFLTRRWDATTSRRLGGALTRTIPTEAAVGAAVVAAVALLTLATPASSLISRLQPTEAAKFTSVVRQRTAAGDLYVDLAVQPEGDGAQRVSAELQRDGNSSSADRPLVVGQGLGVTQVRFRFRPVSESIGESRVIATEAGENAYAAEGAFLPFKGRWEIRVDVRRRDADDVSARFVIDTERDQRQAYARVLAAETVVYSIARDSANPRLLLAVAGEDGVYRSTDGGNTWGGPAGPAGWRVVASPGQPSSFVAAGPAGMYRTSDGGQSWTALYQEKGNQVFDIAFGPGDPRTILAASDRGVLRSRDAGATWDLRLASAPPSGGASQPDSWTRLATAPDGTIITGRRPGVIAVSRDGGENWVQRSNIDLPGGVMGMMIEPSGPRRWFVGSMGSGVWVSGDAGESWVQVKTGISPNGHGAGFIETADGKVIVATTGQGVLMTSDGTNWSQVGDDGIEQGIAEGVTLTKDAAGKESLLVAGIGIYRLDLDSPAATGEVASH